jgi:hypothetical protein
VNDQPTSLVTVDVERTRIHDAFFRMFAFDSPDELLNAVDGMDVDLSSLARCRDIRVNLADGWLYWFLFTKGFLQYRQRGDVERGNVYLDYLMDYFLAHGHNPAMRHDLEDFEIARERVMRRYRDFDAFSKQPAPDEGYDVAPIRVTTSEPPAPFPYQFFVTGSDEPIIVRAIDGWHRLCSARLCGVSSIRCEVIPERLSSRPIDGAIERLTQDSSRLSISGWWLNPEEPIYNYELRSGGRTIAAGVPVLRPDIQEAHPDIAHAARSGFAVECNLPGDEQTPPLLLVGLQDIVPVGVLDIGLEAMAA